MFCPAVLTNKQLRPTVLKFFRTMARSNSESAASRLESLTAEYQICRRKLESKCEALLILSRELDQCRSERDQFKLMAEQLRDRYQMVKRQLTGDTPMSSSHVEVDPKTYSDIQTQSLARLLFDTKEANKSLKFEVEDLKQKLQDAEGDIKLLREQIVRSRVGTTDEGLNTRHFPAHEREDLVKQLEVGREEYVQLERDLQQVLDEKEELVTERDAYRTKYERLNTELNYILGGDEKRIVDIDALSMENKFLQEKLKQMEEEKSMAMATVTKYKSILEKKKTKGILKLGQSRSGGLVITQKQVQQIMQSRSSITPTPQALADLQGLCGALLDTISDKNLALSHQRKTNKLLGNRVSELEKKLKTLEMSGLWSISGNFQNLEKLKAECEEIKTLVPRKFSHSTDTSEPAHEASDLGSVTSSAINSTTTSPARQKHTLNQLSRLDLEELDLLPTKEEVVKGDGYTEFGASLEADGNAASTCDKSSHGTDTSVGISGIEEESTRLGMSRVVLTEEMLKSLLGSSRRVTGASGGDCGISHRDAFDNNWLKANGEIDSEDREAAIQRCLRQDSDDTEEAYDGYDFDEDEDEDEEVGDEFRSLLESVTQKLLQRSQQLEHTQENQRVLHNHQQKSVAKDKNVYISDDFGYDISLPLDLNMESLVQSSNDTHISEIPEHSSVLVDWDVVNRQSKEWIKQDNEDRLLLLDATLTDYCSPANDVSKIDGHIVKLTLHKLSTSSSETENKEQADTISKSMLHKLSISSSETENNEQIDTISKSTPHKLSTSISETENKEQTDTIFSNAPCKLSTSSSNVEKEQGDVINKCSIHRLSASCSDITQKGNGDTINKNTSYKHSTSSSETEEKGDTFDKNTPCKLSASSSETENTEQAETINKNMSNNNLSTTSSNTENQEQADRT